jgi:hypothetical protein
MGTTDSTLIRIQRNRILKLVEQHGPPPSEFDWTETLQGSPGTGICRVSVLTHRPTGFYCIFGAASFQMSPGWSRKVQEVDVTTFQRQEEFCAKWLIVLKFEVEADDLWADLQKDSVDRLAQVELANAALEDAQMLTAASELREAYVDLARRPPDLTGAVQHSLAALECIAREHCSDHATFGKLLQRYDELFPRPLDQGIEKIWGFASEMDRHLQEGRTPREEEAKLLVGLATASCIYLARRIKSGSIWAHHYHSYEVPLLPFRIFRSTFQHATNC